MAGNLSYEKLVYISLPFFAAALILFLRRERLLRKLVGRFARLAIEEKGFAGATKEVRGLCEDSFVLATKHINFVVSLALASISFIAFSLVHEGLNFCAAFAVLGILLIVVWFFIWSHWGLSELGGKKALWMEIPSWVSIFVLWGLAILEWFLANLPPEGSPS